jgi:hypothetical protein
LDVAQGYQVEKDLTRLIEKRHDYRVKTEGERREEEMYAETERQHWQRVNHQHLWERLRYHDRIIASHEGTFECLVGRHRAEVERLEALLGISPNGEEGEA